jgi:hypothetical protein
MIIEGIWKGEYVYDEYCKVPFQQVTIPFTVSIRQSGVMGMSGGFEGIWQDESAKSNITIAANIYGLVTDQELFFVKLYPKTFGYDELGNFFVGDEPHPEIFYKGLLWKDDILHGTWKIGRTFRKVNGRLYEISDGSGLWWIKKT